MIPSLTFFNFFPLAFGIPSGPDLFILLIIVLVLFGAKRLPEIARSLGQSVNEFKKAKDEFEKEATITTPVSNSPAPTTPQEKTSSTIEEPPKS